MILSNNTDKQKLVFKTSFLFTLIGGSLKYTKEILEKAVLLKEHGFLYPEITKQLNKDFHSDFSISSVNHAVLSFQRGEYKNLIRQPRIKENNSKAKESVTAKKSVDDNGNITSIDFDIKFEDFRKRSNKSPEDILKFAGYDIKDWQVSNITNNDWSVTNKDGDKYWNHQVKLSAKPRNKSGLSIDEIIYLFNKNIEPVHIRQESQSSFKTNLVIPLADLHFSEMTYEEYLPYLKGIKQIVAKGYKTIVIEQLGDLFDSDKINSEETVKGTQLEDGNMPQAVEDASKFIFDLIQFCIKHSNNFSMKYVGGNHDFDESYMFQWAIKQRFPQADIDINNGYRNAYLLDNVGIVISHGDVSEKKIPALFPVEFKDVYTKAKWAESHSGHLHYLRNEDMNGLMFRQFPTPVKGNSWNYKMGLTMAHKFMEIIEYYPDKPKEVYYI